MLIYTISFIVDGCCCFVTKPRMGNDFFFLFPLEGSRRDCVVRSLLHKPMIRIPKSDFAWLLKLDDIFLTCQRVPFTCQWNGCHSYDTKQVSSTPTTSHSKSCERVWNTETERNLLYSHIFI